MKSSSVLNLIIFFQCTLLIICVIGFFGWAANIWKLTKCDFESPWKAEGIRAIGVVVPPIGAFVGLMDIEDGSVE
jgi:hypothetical protein